MRRRAGELARNPVIGLEGEAGKSIEVEVAGGCCFRGTLRCADKYNNLILDGVEEQASRARGIPSVFIRGTHIVTISLPEA